MDSKYILSTTAEELQKSIHRLKSKTMRDYGFGTSDLACLMMLKQTPEGLTSTELSRECRIDKALISRTVKKLIEMDAIAYVAPRISGVVASEDGSKTIRRGAYRIRLKLTEHGEDMADHICAVASEAAAYATAEIGAKELADFLVTLGKINDRFKLYVENGISDKLD